MRLVLLLALAACTRTPQRSTESYAITVTEHLADGGTRSLEYR